jgi:hypothetical protein
MQLLRFTLVLLLACGGRLLIAQPFSHEVHASQQDDARLKTAPSTLWVTATGFGPNEVKAQADAEKAIFETLLFQGIAGTQHATPMVPNGPASKSQHATFYTTFFDELGYRPFVTNTVALSGLLKLKKGGKKLDTRILIDINALRRHLEENGIVAKFGM